MAKDYSVDSLDNNSWLLKVLHLLFCGEKKLAVYQKRTCLYFLGVSELFTNISHQVLKKFADSFGQILQLCIQKM